MNIVMDLTVVFEISAPPKPEYISVDHSFKIPNCHFFSRVSIALSTPGVHEPHQKEIKQNLVHTLFSLSLFSCVKNVEVVVEDLFR
jgi:hypothetical protein